MLMRRGGNAAVKVEAHFIAPCDASLLCIVMHRVDVGYQHSCIKIHSGSVTLC